MVLSLKQELEINIRAVAAFDQQDYDTAFAEFERIADTGSKIKVNMALLLAANGQHEDAIEHFQAALRLDRYLAVAYFQQGVSHFLVGQFQQARTMFDETMLYLRGNTQIDYEQLGLPFKLFSCEVLFNRGLCDLSLGDEGGFNDLRMASKQKQNEEHIVIDIALRNKGVGANIFSMPVGKIYRPDEAKVRNLATKNYLGIAKVIASSDVSDVGTGFRGSERLRQNAISTQQGIAYGFEQSSPLQSRSTPGSLDKALPNVVDKHLSSARDLEFLRLDQALQRKASSKTMRENFPIPSRSNTLVRGGTSEVSASSNQERLLLTKPRVSPAFDSAGTGQEPRVVGNARQNKNLPIVYNTRMEKPLPKQEPKSLRKSQYSSTSPSKATFSEQLAQLQRELPKGESVAETQSSRSELSARSAVSSTSSVSKYDSSNYGDAQPDSEEDDYDDLIHPYYTRNSEYVEVASTFYAPRSVTDIKVKICGLEDIQVFLISSDTSWEEFQRRLRAKTGWIKSPKLRTRDDEGEMILLQDEEDLQSSIQCSTQEAQRLDKTLAKLEIWVKP